MEVENLLEEPARWIVDIVVRSEAMRLVFAGCRGFERDLQVKMVGQVRAPCRMCLTLVRIV